MADSVEFPKGLLSLLASSGYTPAIWHGLIKPIERLQGSCICREWTIQMSIYFELSQTGWIVGTTRPPGKNVDLEATADARICTSNMDDHRNGQLLVALDNADNQGG